MEYFPFGEVFIEQNGSYGTPYKYNGKELDSETGLYYYGARYYNPELSLWLSVDPLVEKYPSMSPYNYVANNPLIYIDPDGRDWVEADLSLWQKVKNFFGGNEQKQIVWKDDITSQEDISSWSGDKWLGKNVLVGTHNRDENLKEPINSATFDLYLESDKTGATAKIKGNTIPADIDKYGTLKEGLYPAKYSIYKGDGALLINSGGDLPTVNGNPNNKKNYKADGSLKPANEHVIDEVFFHKGNYGRESLSTSKGSLISAGCQTGRNGSGSLSEYRTFIKKAVGFKGNYYLKSKN